MWERFERNVTDVEITAVFGIPNLDFRKCHSILRMQAVNLKTWNVRLKWRASVKIHAGMFTAESTWDVPKNNRPWQKIDIFGTLRSRQNFLKKIIHQYTLQSNTPEISTLKCATILCAVKLWTSGLDFELLRLLQHRKIPNLENWGLKCHN